MSVEQATLLADLIARCTFDPPGTVVVCAVSGGPDSTALLALVVAAGLEATAVHVDHGLRPDSEREALVVAATAERLGTGFRSEKVAVEPGPNLEARARRARFDALPADVLTGHTADDQAETVLLNLMRGAGIEGMAAIRTDPRHPILALRRTETVGVCQELGLEVVDDPSNRDPSFRRNRVRLELVPLMNEIAERDVVPVIARQATLARDVADHLLEQSHALDPRDSRALADAPLPLARLAIRTWLRSTSAERHPPDAATVDRVLAVARHDAVATDVGSGWRVTRSAGRLMLVPPST